MATEYMEQLFIEHQNLIPRTIRKNRALLSALGLEDEDVAQQLAIAMCAAIRKYDPERSSCLAAHLWCSLRYEILNIKRRHKPHGLTGVPKGLRLSFLYLDSPAHGGGSHELPSYDDVSGAGASCGRIYYLTRRSDRHVYRSGTLAALV